MKLTSLFHLSLITLAAGLTADLTAAAATVQPKDQSSASASAQAEAKEARADRKAPESKPQPLALRFQKPADYIWPFTFNKKENFSILVHLLNRNIKALRKLAAQSELIPVSPAVLDAIQIINITEQEETARDVENSIARQNISLEGSMAWYTAYMQAVASKKITLGKNLNGAVGACIVKLIKENTTSEFIHYIERNELISTIKIDNIIKLLLQYPKLSTITMTTKYGNCNAAQYMFLMAYDPRSFFYPSYSSQLQDIYTNVPGWASTQQKIKDSKLVDAYLSLLPKQSLFKLRPKDAEELSSEKVRAEARKTIEAYKKQWAEESNKEKQAQNEQAKSATAAKQQPKVAQADTDHPQANPAPAEPVQPKNIFTRTKDFFHAHRWAKFTTIALVSTAAIYGGYRLYKHVNMRKLARYAGNWA